jgi:hypothetical protein
MVSPIILISIKVPGAGACDRFVETSDQREGKPMKLGIFVAIAFAAVTTSNAALAQTKSEKCAAYARQMTASTPTTTGPVRGAARGAAAGAVGGAIVGKAGKGAAIGAAVGAGVGTARGAAQKSRSY